MPKQFISVDVIEKASSDILYKNLTESVDNSTHSLICNWKLCILNPNKFQRYNRTLLSLIIQAVYSPAENKKKTGKAKMMQKKKKPAPSEPGRPLNPPKGRYWAPGPFPAFRRYPEGAPKRQTAGRHNSQLPRNELAVAMHLAGDALLFSTKLLNSWNIICFQNALQVEI